MAVDDIRYDLLAKEALRGVVRTVLAGAAKNGLPGEHHFYISFDTRADGVRLSPRMHAQYPTEMTIVLQHQFWDLTVTDQAFEIGLSFKGIPERLSIPFEAVKGFFDPSVQFGLQFATQTASEPAAAPAEAEDTKRRESKPVIAPAAEPKLALPAQAPADAGEPEPRPPGPGGEVVRLDRFRKK